MRAEVARMDMKAAAVSPLYLLERFDVGVVQLDAMRHVTAAIQ